MRSRHFVGVRWSITPRGVQLQWVFSGTAGKIRSVPKNPRRSVPTHPPVFARVWEVRKNQPPTTSAREAALARRNRYSVPDFPGLSWLFPKKAG